jgi:hypothetical protein
MLIPADLIVNEGPAALSAGGAGAPGAWAGPGAGPVARAGGIVGPNGNSRAAANGAVRLPATPAAGNEWQMGWSAGAGARPGSGQAPAAPGGAFGASPFGVDAFSADAPTAGIRISGALRHPGSTAGGDAATGGRRGGRHGSDDVPVVTGVPVGRPAQPPVSSFDVFTPIPRSEQDGSGYAPEAGYPQAYPDFGSPAPESGHQSGDSGGGVDANGLPRRVRQASIAPELRATAAANSAGSAGIPTATAASLTDMRNTLSAMQRGWQQGRSQSQRDTEGSGFDGD